ncbi:MAG: hypothetical protein AAGM84_04055 [Pseudomonadota bacterium]
MTATNEFINDGVDLRMEPLRGARAIVRLLLTMLGVGLVIAALMLWVMPGSSFDADLLLMKGVLSVTMGAAGWAALSAGRTRPVAREIEVDLVRREVRVVQRRPSGDSVEHVCAFRDLGRAETAHGVVGLWDADGVHLADVALRDRTAGRLLTSALRDAGKL